MNPNWYDIQADRARRVHEDRKKEAARQASRAAMPKRRNTRRV